MEEMVLDLVEHYHLDSDGVIAACDEHEGKAARTWLQKRIIAYRAVREMGIDV
jgi:hypothetical protein